MMQPKRALEIVRLLVDGIDPYTGEIFSPESSYQHPDTVRALHLAIRALERLETWVKRQEHLPENAGQPWTEEDEQRLQEDYAAGVSVKELASKHKRTEGAIQSRLLRLGIVERSG